MCDHIYIYFLIEVCACVYIYIYIYDLYSYCSYKDSRAYIHTYIHAHIYIHPMQIVCVGHICVSEYAHTYVGDMKACMSVRVVCVCVCLECVGRERE